MVGAGSVEQVIRVATRVVEGRYTGREGVTILATLTRPAMQEAAALRQADPVRASTYREVILAIGRELRRRENETGSKADDPRQLHAVTDDLAKVLRSLGPGAEPA
jgi:hypothetical protein